MNIQRLWPQRAVSPFCGCGSCCLAAAFEGHPWRLGITTQRPWLETKSWIILQPKHKLCLQFVESANWKKKKYLCHLHCLAKASYCSILWRRYQVDQGWNFDQWPYALVVWFLRIKETKCLHLHSTVIWSHCKSGRISWILLCISCRLCLIIAFSKQRFSKWEKGFSKGGQRHRWLSEQKRKTIKPLWGELVPLVK